MRNELLQLLVQHSYERANYPKFDLSSGAKSDTYVNCKTTTTLAEAGPKIGAVCADLIPATADAIGGLTMGADAIASAISAYLHYVRRRELNTFVVRKEPKKHGTKLWVEGNPGKRVVVVDDVVTTGGSTITAIERCRAENIEVLAVIVLVDREESGGLDAVKKEAGGGVPVHAIFSKSELAQAVRSTKVHHVRAGAVTSRDPTQATSAVPDAAD